MEAATEQALRQLFQELTDFLKWLRVVIDEERKK